MNNFKDKMLANFISNLDHEPKEDGKVFSTEFHALEQNAPDVILKSKFLIMIMTGFHAQRFDPVTQFFFSISVRVDAFDNVQFIQYHPAK